MIDVIRMSSPCGGGRVPFELGLADPGGRLMKQSLQSAEQQLERTWMWLVAALDSFEAQLLSGAKYAASVAAVATEPALSGGAKPPKRGRRHDGEKRPLPLGQLNFRQYLLTLMRSHSGEHGGALPVVDVSATKHLAHTLDAFIYYFQAQVSKDIDASSQSKQPDRFFVRSESIVEGGAIAPSVFTTPLEKALPLANRPDQLYPSSTRSKLFGGSQHQQEARAPPRHLGLSNRVSAPMDTQRDGSWATGSLLVSRAPSHSMNILPSLADFAPDVPAERWSTMTGLFVDMFMDDLGPERNSFLTTLGGYRVREERFRKAMDQLQRALPERRGAEVVLKDLKRTRVDLLAGTIKQLNTHIQKSRRKELPFACHSVKVTFKDEPGEGTGVARSYFASVAEALLQSGDFPPASDCSVAASASAPDALWAARSAPGGKKASSGSGLSTAELVKISAAPEEEGRTLLIDYVTSVALGNETMKSKKDAKRAATSLVDATNQTTLLLTLAINDRGEIEKLLRAESDQLVKEAAGSGAATKGSGAADAGSDLDSQHYIDQSAAVNFDPGTPVVKQLFHAPGQPGFFCPVPGEWTAYRLSWFRTVGRLMGLCVLHNDILPVTFVRPVLKFILGRTIAWHDLAFFDPVVFESMRKMIVDAPTVANLDLCFQINLPEWMGGATRDLVPNGEAVPVTSENIHKYVELYAQQIMVEAIRPALVAMRAGLLDVVPHKTLSGLTAEDFRLLLNGCHAVDVELLERCTDFEEAGCKSSDLVAKTAKWVWAIVKEMTPAQQHDLIYFWTGSPSLPATEAGLVPRPSVHVRPASEGDAGMLPTSNTCISRILIPVYRSKEILQQKLLMAIQTKTFGFV